MAETADITAINELTDSWKLGKEKTKQMEFHTDEGFNTIKGSPSISVVYHILSTILIYRI